MKEKKVISVACSVCHCEYDPYNIPDVCGCGNAFGLWGGGFHNVYEEEDEDEDE